MKENQSVIVFTPDNEPYLGRLPLYHLDQAIASSLNQYDSLSDRASGDNITAHQLMALQQSSQFLSVLCSLRELIRQGYLLGASVLTRPLIERQTILVYLYLFPDKMKSWEKGWHARDAPGLSRMIDEIQKHWERNEPVKGREILKQMNSVLHAKPDSMFLNLVHRYGEKFAYSPSKILNNPVLCDDICLDVIPSVSTVHAMLNAYFPSDNN